MELIVDLHIHSPYSRATSKQLTVENIYRWGKIKGVNVIGTGDFTHPVWFAELRDKLEPAEQGLFKLNEKDAEKVDRGLPASVAGNRVRFVLSVEISNIYKRHERARRLHNLVIAPSFEVVSEINSRLAKIGNLKSDGRPILGLDSEELLKISLEADPDNLFIPSHIWTPWFAMFGSKSGFDSIEEAFGGLADKIVAVETGLSSDPFMNWRLSALEGITLVSNSDAHSLEKLGREANVMKIKKLSYGEIVGAIKTGDERFGGTIEFFPQEGKYHFDGHKSCQIRMSPAESKKHRDICPKCGRELVLGVDHRVEELADRGAGHRPKGHKRVEYIIPLAEMIAEVKKVVSVKAVKVVEEYERMTQVLGDEFSILRKVEIGEIRRAGFGQMATAIERMRSGKIRVEPGYDGVYGVIKVFKGGELEASEGQMNLGL